MTVGGVENPGLNPSVFGNRADRQMNGYRIGCSQGPRSWLRRPPLAEPHFVAVVTESLLEVLYELLFGWQCVHLYVLLVDSIRRHDGCARCPSPLV